MHTYNLRPRPIKREITIINKISKPKRVKKTKNVINNQLFIVNFNSVEPKLEPQHCPMIKFEPNPQTQLQTVADPDPETYNVECLLETQSIKEPCPNVDEDEIVDIWEGFRPDRQTYLFLVFISLIQITLMAVVVYKIELPQTHDLLSTLKDAVGRKEFIQPAIQALRMNYQQIVSKARQLYHKSMNWN